MWAVGTCASGRRGSLSVKVPPHPRAGVWFDYEAWEGGGVSELRSRLTGSPLSSRRAAVAPVERRAAVPAGDGGAWASALWGRSSVVPGAGVHPARLWLGRRGLWRPEVPVSGALRWVWDADGRGGRLLALSAEPGAWAAAWPGVPAPRAVERIPVGVDGSSGGAKKSLGPMAGGVMVLGPPGGGPGARAAVCEGVADGLALSTGGCPVVVVLFGTSGMIGAARSGVADYLAGFGGGVEIWADRDPPSRDAGRGAGAPPGGRAAYALRRAVRAVGGGAEVWQVEGAWKDVAARAEGVGLLPLEREGLVAVGEGIVSREPGWPRWYVWQRAAVEACLEASVAVGRVS